MLSWYPTNELPLRFLFWSVFRAVLQYNKYWHDALFYTWVCHVVLNIVTLVVLLMTNFMDRVGGPKDITWLSPHQKLYCSDRSAASEFRAVARKGVWRNRQQLVIKLVQPFSVFLISLLSSLSISGPYTHPYIPYVSEAGGAAVMFLAGLALYKYPSQLLCTVAVCYLLSSAATLVSTSSLENYILFPLHLVRQLGHVVQPLLWAIAVHETQTWAEALGSVSLAMIGPVIGQTILLFTSDKLKTFTVQLPLLVSQVTVWAVLWARKQKLGVVRLPEDTPDRRTTTQANHSEEGIDEH
ncbi:hypothetical protein LZ32DRAFT_199100 [Colletotrichum eremochloae]|nr:hypothetical protein LZ32DRAFT_199100 [Colletotrichum eremochloae]